MDSYKGESPSKKLVRLSFWVRVQEALGVEAFVSGKHLVLASREAGDVSVLLGLGVPPQNIIAVEINLEAAALAQKKFPQVKIVVGCVGKLVQKYHRSLTSIFLDFCTPPSEKLMEMVRRVVCFGMKDAGMVGLAFQAAREDGVPRALTNALRDSNSSFMKVFELPDDVAAERVLRSIRGDPRPSHQKLVEELSCPGVRRAEALKGLREGHAFLESTHHFRGEAIQYALNTALEPHRCVIVCKHTWSYQSRTKESRGVPMFVHLGQLHRFKGSLTRAEFESAWQSYGTAAIPHVVTFNDDDLREFALSHTGAGANMYRLLNVPKMTVAAWRAHRTMGTYKKDGLSRDK